MMLEPLNWTIILVTFHDSYVFCNHQNFTFKYSISDSFVKLLFLYKLDCFLHCKLNIGEHGYRFESSFICSLVGDRQVCKCKNCLLDLCLEWNL